MSERPGWDDVWLALAELMGQRTRCPGRKAGAVIVDCYNRVVSTGYAGPPASFRLAQNLPPDAPCAIYCKRAVKDEDARDPGYLDCVSSHAEANAIIMADRSRMGNGVFYINTVPCWACAKMIANTGVTMAVWADDGRGDSSQLVSYFRDCGIISDPRKVRLGPKSPK